MKRFVGLFALLLLLLPNLGWAMSVAFINPGKSDEAYWLTVSRAMEAAAKDLDIRFEVLYAERQHPMVFELARQIIARPVAERPDYVVITIDKAQ